MILEKVLDRIRSYKNPSEIACIFDLDSTLFDLTDRKQQILLYYLKQNSENFKAEREKLRKIQIHKNEFGIDEALERVGLSKKNNPAFYQELYKFWESYFYHDDFLKFDRTFAGAVDYVKKVQALGAEVIYLTGRDEPRMLKGTLASLRACGFPLDEKNIRVCLKPHSSVSDHGFKIDFMINIEKQFKEIWVFENEPVNINLIEKHLPHVNFVFIDSNHSGLEEIGGHHPSIKDFK